MENRAETMAEGRYDFGFAIEWMAKDLGYALEEAQRHGLALPQAGHSLSDYRELMARGLLALWFSTSSHGVGLAV